MTHPLLMYDLARLKNADDLRRADHDRLVREAGAPPFGRIDTVPFRERLTRLFGVVWPSANDGAATTGA
jgi:hypothetical protein